MNEPHVVHVNAAFLDQALDRLRARTTVDDRLAILRTLVGLRKGDCGTAEGGHCCLSTRRDQGGG